MKYPHNATQYKYNNIILQYAIQYYITICNTILYYNMQYNTVQYSTAFSTTLVII